ncbi:leucine-rich repeat domain-containing protein [Ascidiimonas sp. W6]|uniref:leucine-rich repeat domain-containing protein n=1 Tax=Ascidiimonas meishanensis TaxID=3128903 RepID=UPI0030ED54D5
MPEDIVVSEAVTQALEKINTWESQNPPTTTTPAALDLSGMGLTNKDLEDLIPELSGLSNLNMLIISHNELTKLPDEIGLLSNLQVLAADNNKLTELPSKIGRLTELVLLKINDNELTALPQEIEQLQNLVDLDASNNQLNTLTKAIGQLTNLENLLISNNQLTELPPEVGNLSKLRVLKADNNDLVILPREIGGLSKLNTLEADNNKLAGLPPEIGRLSELQVLSASNNQLLELPSTIGYLTKLEMLLLSDNKLAKFPQQVGKLSNLLKLDANNNQLTKLTSHIAMLGELQELGIRNNLLTEVPRHILALQNLTELDAARNPLNEESLKLLTDTFPAGGSTMLRTESDSIEKLNILYPNASREEILQKDLRIGSLNREGTSFTDGNDRKASMLKGDKVVDIFLAHVKANHEGPDVTKLYHDATTYLLERALSTDSADSEAALTQLASSLGNCPTPVIDFMEKTGVQLALDSSKNISETLRTILHRQAFEAHINKERIVPFSLKERIEFVQGLTNTLFLENAETKPENTLKIQGNRPRITPKTENIEFAFEQITEKMSAEFAKSCCITDDSNNPIEDAQGQYQLDPDKYFTITEKYLENQGILDVKAQARKHFIEELTQLIRQPENRELAIDNDLIDFEKREDSLRLAMKTAPDDQVKTIIDQNREEFKVEMERVRNEYDLSPASGVVQDAGSQQAQSPSLPLGDMVIPSNEAQRTRTPTNRRNRNANTNENRSTTPRISRRNN